MPQINQIDLSDMLQHTYRDLEIGKLSHKDEHKQVVSTEPKQSGTARFLLGKVPCIC